MEIIGDKIKKILKNRIFLAIFIIIVILLITFIILKNVNNRSTLSTYIVQFESLGGSKVPYQKIEEGCKVEKPEDPMKEGFQFLEWTLNEEKYDFDRVVDRDITLVAVWKANTDTIIRTVTFNSNGGSNIVPIEIAKGSSITEPIKPTKEGYIFIGWYLNDEQFDFNTMIENDITLEAQWEENKKEIEEKQNHTSLSNISKVENESNKPVENNKNENKEENRINNSNNENIQNNTIMNGNNTNEKREVNVNPSKITIYKGEKTDIRISYSPKSADWSWLGARQFDNNIIYCNGYVDDPGLYTIYRSRSWNNDNKIWC